MTEGGGRVFWPGGFDAWKGRWKNRKRWDRAHETQPRPWSTSPEAGTRPRKTTGGLGLALRPGRATTCLGEGWAARAIHSLRVHKREAALAATSLDPLAVQRRRAGRSQGMVRRRRVRTYCARIRLRDGRGCWWARQHATSVPTSLLRGKKRLTDHTLGAALQAAACSRRARFCDAVARRAGRGFGGAK